MKTYVIDNALFKRYCSLVYICLFVLTSSMYAFFNWFDAEQVVYILAILVVLLGLPHGALDYKVARSIHLVDSIKSAIYFNFAYISVGLIGILIWILVPWFGLSLFLIISALHFSADWRYSLSFITRLCVATILLCGPAVLYSEQVAFLFNVLLVPFQQSVLIVTLLKGLFVISCSALLIISILGFLKGGLARQEKTLIAEISVLTFSSLLLPPLMHFVLYFCFLHSPKHLSDVAVSLKLSVHKAFVYSIPLVLFTLLIAILATFFLTSGQLTTDILRWVFIGLFGLTLAHMCLVHLWHKKLI